MSVQGVSFGQLLRMFRVARVLTQEELAERTGLSTRGISDLERGARRNPRLVTVRRLAAALELGEDDQARFHWAAEPLRFAAPPNRLSLAHY